MERVAVALALALALAGGALRVGGAPEAERGGVVWQRKRSDWAEYGRRTAPLAWTGRVRATAGPATAELAVARRLEAARADAVVLRSAVGALS